MCAVLLLKYITACKMFTEVMSKIHLDFSSAESGSHCSNDPYFLPGEL